MVGNSGGRYSGYVRLTISLGFCGVMSIFSSLRYCLGDPNDYTNLWLALGFMPFGLFFDFYDGKVRVLDLCQYRHIPRLMIMQVARWRGKSSLLGQELDSLAD